MSSSIRIAGCLLVVSPSIRIPLLRLSLFEFELHDGQKFVRLNPAKSGCRSSRKGYVMAMFSNRKRRDIEDEWITGIDEQL